MPESAPTSALSRNRFRILTVALLMVGMLVVLIFRSHREREAIRNAIKQELAALRAQGLAVTADDLCRKYPDPPAEEDALILFSETFRSHVSPHTYASLPILGGAPLPKGTNRMPSHVHDDVRAYLHENEKAYHALPTNWPANARFPGHWCDGFAKQRSIPLVEARRLVQTLALRAAYYAEEGNSEQSINSLQWLVRVSNALPKEDLVTYMIGRACLGLGAEGLRRLLNQCQLTEAELMRLHGILADDWITDLPVEFPGERCRKIWAFESTRDQEELTSIVGSDNLKPVVRLQRLVGLARPLYRDDDYLLYLKGEAAYLHIASLPWQQRIQAVREIDNNAAACQSVVGQMARTHWETILRRASEISAQMSLLRAALAVERYRLQSGVCPENLQEINPQFFNTPARDLFDGQPLRYEKRTTGYRIYSVGPDGIDNGGAEKPPNAPSPTEYDLSLTLDR